MTWTDPSELTTTNGEVLSQSDTILIRDNFLHIWSDAPRITVRLTSDQEVADATNHVVQWDEAAWDSTGGGMWDSGTKGSIVVPAGGGGLYLGVAGHQWEGTTDDNSKRSFRVMKNGGSLDSDDLGGDDRLSTSSPRGSAIVLTSLAAGDYLELWARQLSGDALDLLAHRTRFTLLLIGADPSL